jgi:BlaI family penicillinase repressor
VSSSIPKVTDAELGVLKLLWEKEPLTVREITEELYGSSSNSDIGTVHKFLQRLELKAIVSCDRSRHTHQFSSTVSRTEFAGEQLEKMAKKLTDGSVAPFIVHLMQAKRLSRKDLDELRKLLGKGNKAK